MANSRFAIAVANLDLSAKIAESLAILRDLQNKVHYDVSLAFSGGKDSIVATHLASQVFGSQLPGVCETSFCFQVDRDDYIRIAKLMNHRIDFRDSLSYEWLADNQEYIFAPMKLQGKFYGLRQQATVKRWAREKEKRAVIFGRRTQENTVPKVLYEQNGIWQCHPIRNWKTVEIWSYIKQNDLAYPAIYDTELGRMEGATPWLTLNPAKWDDPWQVIYDREPGIVERVAQFHSGAAQWLGTR